MNHTPLSFSNRSHCQSSHYIYIARPHAVYKKGNAQPKPTPFVSTILMHAANYVLHVILKTRCVMPLVHDVSLLLKSYAHMLEIKFSIESQTRILYVQFPAPSSLSTLISSIQRLVKIKIS